MSKTDYVDRDLSGADLRHADLTDQVFYRSILHGAQLYDARISLNCATFDGARIDADQVALFLRLLLMTDMPGPWRDELWSLLRRMLPVNKRTAIERLVQLHVKA